MNDEPRLQTQTYSNVDRQDTGLLNSKKNSFHDNSRLNVSIANAQNTSVTMTYSVDDGGNYKNFRD